jgi:hypothetical protein
MNRKKKRNCFFFDVILNQPSILSMRNCNLCDYEGKKEYRMSNRGKKIERERERKKKILTNNKETMMAIQSDL